MSTSTSTQLLRSDWLTPSWLFVGTLSLWWQEVFFSPKAADSNERQPVMSKWIHFVVLIWQAEDSFDSFHIILLPVPLFREVVWNILWAQDQLFSVSDRLMIILWIWRDQVILECVFYMSGTDCFAWLVYSDLIPFEMKLWSKWFTKCAFSNQRNILHFDLLSTVLQQSCATVLTQVGISFKYHCSNSS